LSLRGEAEGSGQLKEDRLLPEDITSTICIIPTHPAGADLLRLQIDEW
jgi:hypothetical protein